MGGSMIGRTIPRGAGRRGLLTGLAAGLLTSVLAACSGEAPPEQAAVIRPAKLVEISTQTNVQTLNFPAVITARSSAALGFQVGGKIQALPVKDGQTVKEGDVIARLDQATFKNDLSTAQAQYNSANADYQRARRLIKENAISRSVFEQRRSAQRVALAALSGARKGLNDSVLRIPFDGVVSSVATKQFQNVSPGETVATLQTTGAQEATIKVPATLVAHSTRIEPLDTSVLLDSAPGVRIPAKFHSAETQANAETQTFTLRFAFTPPADLRVLPGMTGQIESKIAIVGADGNTESIKVPIGSVFSDGKERYVWVVDTEAMTVSRRTLQLAAAVGEQLPVLEGLAAGETIVGAGASYLHEGMQIRRYEP